MQAIQITTYSVNGKTYPETITIPVTPEADEPRHLESGVLNVYPDITYQKLDGFGGAITESVASLLQKMSPETSRALLQDCFGAQGNRYKFIRMHMDSCDYSLDEYAAVADPLADPDLETFNIDRDRQYAIPFVRQAMAIAPEPLSILVSPWSPPAAWKTPPAKPKNDASVYASFFGSSLPPVDYEHPSRCNGGSLKPEFYASWASYLVKYVQSYLQEGLPVDMLSIQNESIAATFWDSCVWTAEEQKVFLRDHLYPAFAAAGLAEKVGIYIWDHNKERVLEFSRAILDDATSPMVQGLAFHWYSGDHFEAVAMSSRLYPDKILMSSECCGLHQPGQAGLFAALTGDKTEPKTVEYQDAVAYAHDIIGNINAGMNRWIDWNICVDEQGGPRHVPGGFAGPITAHADGTYTRTITFDYIGHFSRFILPGATRVGHSRCDDKIEMTAACNPDGSLVIVLLNKGHEDQAYAIRVAGQVVRVKTPARTLSTVVI